MKKMTVIVLFCVLCSCKPAPDGEENQPVLPTAATSQQSTSSAAQENSAPALSAAAQTPQSTPIPKLGPKSNAASYPKIDGGIYENDRFRQTHFNVVQGALVAHFVPKKIVFTLSSTPTNNAVPKVQLAIRLPGGTGWTFLGEPVAIKEQTSLEFPLDNAPEGKYIFSVKYSATEPEMNVRPILFVDSVELVK